MLVHGIMSSIAEFYSRNLATEVTKGADTEGRPRRHPPRARSHRLPQRAPHRRPGPRNQNRRGRCRTRTADRLGVRALRGRRDSVTALLRDLTARGLLSAPSPKRPSRPLGGKNALYRVLTNPYYAGGVIRYKGALHPGAHEPIVEPALFDQVQSLLRARTAKQTRHVQHAHHLKGLLHCGTCAHGCCSTSPPTPGARPTHTSSAPAAPPRRRPAPGGRCPSRSPSVSSRIPTPRSRSAIRPTATSPSRWMRRSTSACQAATRKSPTSWQTEPSSKQRVTSCWPRTSPTRSTSTR